MGETRSLMELSPPPMLVASPNGASNGARRSSSLKVKVFLLNFRRDRRRQQMSPGEYPPFVVMEVVSDSRYS